MPIRDLGYKPYQGERLPPSHNTSVLWRYGMRRAWGSWLVKIAVFAGWIPVVVGVVIVGGMFFLSTHASPGSVAPHIEPAAYVRGLFGFQLWLFVTMVTLGAGAGAIAEDLTHRAFQFYFAKPVTPEQYLLGRITAVALWCFLITFIPAVLLITAVTGTAAPDARLATLGLVLPALAYSLVIATVGATASIGISALSRSRALTMSAWILLFLVPEALGVIVWKVAHWPWLRLASIPYALGVVGDALFKVQPTTDLRWYHALPVLIVIVAGSVYFALHRLRHAQVIT